MFRFTLRDMLWLVALVAMGTSWWADIRRRDSSMKSARLQVEDAEFRVDRARSETKTIREQAKQRDLQLSLRLLQEQAKNDPVIKAQFEDPALTETWEKTFPKMNWRLRAREVP